MSAFLKTVMDRGDDIALFIAFAAAALQSDQAIPQSVTHWIVDLGLLAGIAHKVFWPAAPVHPAQGPAAGPLLNSPGAASAPEQGSPGPFSSTKE